MINVIFKPLNSIQQNINLRNTKIQPQIGFKGNTSVFSVDAISKFKTIMANIDRKSTDLEAKKALADFFQHPELKGLKDKIAQFLNHTDASDWYGGTALHTTALKGFVETSKYLLELGINPAVKEYHFGETALDRAKRSHPNNHELLELLKTHI